MLHFFRKPPESNREALLAALPLRNELVRETPLAAGLRLAAPLKQNPMRNIFAGRAAAQPEKAFELDELGAWVWAQLTGRQSVEQLIHAFATHFRVNLREAEVAVLAFLKTLAKRNLIALAAPATPHRPRKKFRK